MDEKENLEPQIILDELDNPEVEVKEETPTPAPEAPVEEKPVEEAPVEENAPEEAPQEAPAEEEKENPLKAAIELLANASEEDIANLDDESKAKLASLIKEEELREIEGKLSFITKAIDAFQTTIVRSLNENEEFRTSSKTTLQRNVALLEEQVKLSQYNRLLKPLAVLYSNYAFMLDAPIDEKKTRSNIEGILEELQTLLEDYGVTMITAKVGDDFNPVDFRIAKKVETNDPLLDKKVALVKQVGWKKERVVYAPLRADMYVYVEAPAASEETPNQNEGEN